MPAGSYLLDATEPRTGAVASTSVVVAQDQTTVQNVTVAAVGSVQVQVNYARGVPAVNAVAEISPLVTTTLAYPSARDSVVSSR